MSATSNGSSDGSGAKKMRLDGTRNEICIIEPFYGGSHKQLIDLIESELKSGNEASARLAKGYDLYTQTAKKWHWRARVSALYFAQVIKKPAEHNYKVLFASSVLNLAELVALRSDLASTRKVVYFHENQLTYPVRKQTTRNKNEIENKEQRDFQYGYNQVLTSLVADKILFNSEYNKTSFLSNMNSFLNLIPDCKIRINVKRDLEPKCQVAYFPINLDESLVDHLVAETTLTRMLDHSSYESYMNRPIRILWSNRWEHDKNPEEFFDTLIKLNDMGIDFRLSVLGEQFAQVPETFATSRERLREKIIDWGYLPTKMDYYRVLSECDVVVSTSLHEFFGVSIIEACLFGVYPLVPNRLAYPEIYPSECLYSTQPQLVKRLKYICTRPRQFRLSRHQHFKGNHNHNNNSEHQSSASSSSSSSMPSSSELSTMGALELSAAASARTPKIDNYFQKFKWSSLRGLFLDAFSLPSDQHGDTTN